MKNRKNPPKKTLNMKSIQSGSYYKFIASNTTESFQFDALYIKKTRDASGTDYTHLRKDDLSNVSLYKKNGHWFYDRGNFKVKVVEFLKIQE